MFIEEEDNTMVKRYQRGNQNMFMKEEQKTQWSKNTNLYIEEEETTQWSKDTKEVIRISILKNRKHNGQKIPKRLSESVYRRRTDNTMVKRYQRGNQNQYIEEEQTTQWPNDTKEVIKICISMKNRQHNGQTIPKR